MMLGRRYRRLLGGLVLCGVGLASMIASDLGLGPWEVLHQGLSFVTGIPIGMMTIIVGVFVLLTWLPLGERPGIGTVLNVIVVGVVIDLTLLVLDTPDSLALRSVMMLAGPLLFGIGSGFYLGARLGSGPRDGIMMGLARRGIPVGVARATIEVLVLVGGWLLGGTVGVGTVVFALGIGPLVHFFLPRLTVADEDGAGPAPRPVRGRGRRSRARPGRGTDPDPGGSASGRDGRRR
jgi:uncharacterized membrane protein YczE